MNSSHEPDEEHYEDALEDLGLETRSSQSQETSQEQSPQATTALDTAKPPRELAEGLQAEVATSSVLIAPAGQDPAALSEQQTAAAALETVGFEVL